MNIFNKFQVSYIVAIGIVDKLSGYCHSIRDPIDNKPDVAEFLLSSFQFLSSITGLVEVLSSQDQDPTHLWKAYEVTDLAGTVELLYGKYWKNHIRQDKTLLFRFLCKDSSSYIGIFPKFFVF